jgi:hypothetical protein
MSEKKKDESKDTRDSVKINKNMTAFFEEDNIVAIESNGKTLFTKEFSDPSHAKSYVKELSKLMNVSLSEE